MLLNVLTCSYYALLFNDHRLTTRHAVDLVIAGGAAAAAAAAASGSAAAAAAAASGSGCPRAASSHLYCTESQLMPLRHSDT